jgi:hypothetical protein
MLDTQKTIKQPNSKEYGDSYERIFGHSKPNINKDTKRYKGDGISLEAKIAERIAYVPPVGEAAGGVFIKDPKTYKSKLTYEDFK